MRILLAALLFLWCAGSVSRAYGRAVQTARIPQLAEEADTIIVGKLLASDASAQSVRFYMEVIRVLKGTAVTGQMLDAFFSVPQGARASAGPEGGYALWFLHRTLEQNFNVLPVVKGMASFDGVCYPARGEAPARHPYDDAAPVIDKVVSEIADIVEATGAGKIAYRLPAALHPGDSPLMSELYRDWSKSSTVDIKVLGLGGRILEGELDAVLAVRQQVETLTSSMTATSLGLSLSTIRTHDPVVIRSLGEIATISDRHTPLRMGAATALEEIHNRLTIPYLVKLLNDPSPAYRRFAVSGMSKFAANVAVGRSSEEGRRALSDALDRIAARDPGIQANVKFLHFAPFSPEEDEQKYLEYWRQWSATLPQ
ncbi:MAG: HEAT repeat domain-containing protein [Bryobacterales bacterium]|nr:HEAT repeat domain-containing protein [Bryobacterales bacterium]